MASLDDVSTMLDQKLGGLRLALRADIIEQVKKVVTPELVADAVLSAHVPSHPELDPDGTAPRAREVGIVLRDTRIQSARADKQTPTLTHHPT